MRRIALYLLAALALLTLCGARHTATIRRVEGANTFFVVVESAGDKNVRVVVTGISNISAAIDTAKVRLGNIPGIPADLRLVRITAETVDP